MELKEANHLLSSVEANILKPLERNNSDKPSIYDKFFFGEEEESDSTIHSKHSNINNEERKFGNVSTLDWLQTWRSTEIS